MNGIGEGEEVAFEVEPGMDDVIGVANGMELVNEIIMGTPLPLPEPVPSAEAEELAVPSAPLPYEVKIEAEELSADEDNYPTQEEPIPEDELDEVADEEEAIDPPPEPETDDVIISEDGVDPGMVSLLMEDPAQMIEQARPLEGGAAQSGYFQFEGDADLFTVTPDQDAIYEFNYNREGTLDPMLDVYQYDEEEDMLQQVGMGGGTVILDA
ncbi:hypothetical protein [Salsuginibacillus kocurii]|uniref:hypothetical protein n=1 Tax=Salsuginibacillus kocurii TaxID=427078 RepID=UPI0003AA8455|nr:hypothetical protein [Salsuginibacillus kocurii]